MAAALLIALANAGCSDRGTAGGAPGPVPAFETFLTRVDGRTRVDPAEPIEVWLCHVPDGATDPVYGGLPLRLDLTPAAIVTTIGPGVEAYFAGLSAGAYRPLLVAGGEHTMAVDDGPQDCVDAAIAGAAPTTGAVLAVADAEHADGQPGGFGSAGDPCPDPAAPCPVAQSRRAAYVGAADFSPDAGDEPPRDLVEHELGHTLGMVHSAVAGEPEQYLSGLDVMSDSAFPRTLDPGRLDGPGTLAVDRLLAGWLTVADVVGLPDGGEATLRPSNEPAAGAPRLLVLPDGADAFLAVEVLAATGLDDHLPYTGLTVHSVAADASSIDPLVGDTPFTDLLRDGSTITVHGWTLTVTEQTDASWRVTATPAAA